MKSQVKEVMLFVVLPLILTSASLAVIGTHATFQTGIHAVKLKRESDGVTICLNDTCYDDLVFDYNNMKA